MFILNSRNEAYRLLDELEAPIRLKTHVRLVGEAADLLIEKFQEIGVEFDAEFVRIGVVIHDVGKIRHIDELVGAGSKHEPEGERMLLELGVDAKIARVCMSHARFSSMECSLEELTIALSDKLWKGKRLEELELKTIDLIASRLGKTRWVLFSDLDQQFETIANDGHKRLLRSAGS